MVDRRARGRTLSLDIGPGSILAALALSTLLTPGCRPVTPASTEPPPAEATTPAENTSPVASSRPLELPATLPAVPPEAAAPTAPLPPGTPTAEGVVTDLVAIDDERAIVRFIVPGPNHDDRWWVALMHRDGSLQWVQTLSGQLGSLESSTGIEIVGDSVSIVTSDFHGSDPEVSLHAFALADGARRFDHTLGPGYPSGSTVDGARRFDVSQHFSSAPGGGSSAHLTVSSPTGMEWSAPLPPPPPPGPDPTVVGDALVVRSEQRDADFPATWHVFERSTGTLRGTLPAHPQSCSDGTRWFVIVGDALVSVDPRTLKTRRVTGPLELPGRPGTWALDDCVVAGGAPVALVSRGSRVALVAFDAKTFARAGHVELGMVSVGLNGFDPMPAHAHPAVTVFAMTDDDREGIIVADPFASRVIEHWSSTDEYGGFGYMNMTWSGGYVVPMPHTLAVVDGRSGMLEGRAMLPPDAMVRPQQIVGDVVWLPPVDLVRLGARAPRLIDLRTIAPDDVRGAVLVDARRASTAPSVDGRAPCPDPSAPMVGDGTGTDGTLGPVALTRLPTWDIDILYETARRLACAPGAAPARLMAWYVMEDDRPLRNDNALLMIEDTTTQPPRFTLVQVYRHATNREWNVNTSFHSPREPIRTFDHRPNRAEIDDFLGQSGWSFDDDWGRVIAGNVVDEEWRRATHLEPWRSFPKGIERAD